MLSVASVKSASGAAQYFAKDDYYTAEHSSEATAWGGVGAADLGLKGEVTKEDFEKILNGETLSEEEIAKMDSIVCHYTKQLAAEGRRQALAENPELATVAKLFSAG